MTITLKLNIEADNETRLQSAFYNVLSDLAVDVPCVAVAARSFTAFMVSSPCFAIPEYTQSEAWKGLENA